MHLRALILFLIKDYCEGRPELCAPLMTDLMPCCPEEPASYA